jgi:uncharacterized protein
VRFLTRCPQLGWSGERPSRITTETDRHGVTIDPLLLVALAALTAALGTVGGLGGAVLLVPLLVATGTDPLVAAPIGLTTVVAGAIAAAPDQLAQGVVHQRLGVTVELPASAAALVAALFSAQAAPGLLRWLLAATAAAAGIVGLTRTVLHNPPQPQFAAEPAAEWPGTLAGTYQSPSGPIPYQARRLPLGLSAMLVAGAVSGLAGVGGGFVKTPIMRELMWIPVKVAAATSTFTVGITSATSLIVFAGQGRIDLELCVAAGLGGLIGGVAGAHLQDHLPPPVIRRILAVVLLCIAPILVVTG